MLIYHYFRTILIASLMASCETAAVSELNLLEAPLGTLAFASVHEAGHVLVAQSCGLSSVSARVFQVSKYGVGTFWKGQTNLGARDAGKGMALIKLGGIFAEHFLDRLNRITHPSFLDVIGDRDVISQTDKLSQVDLGSVSLLEAQEKTYFIMTSRLGDLDRIYKTLYHRHAYP